MVWTRHRLFEANEAPEDGICREIHEELGLEVVNPRLIGVYPFRRMNCHHRVSRRGP